MLQVVEGRPHRGHAMGLGLGPVVMPWGQQARAVTVTLNLGREATPLQAAGLTSCHTFGLAYGLVAYQAPRVFHQDGVLALLKIIRVTILDLILTLFIASLRPYCECICHLGHFFLEFCHLGHFFLEYVILLCQIHYDFVCHLVHFFLELVLCWRTLSFLGLL